ncbi:MAG TPA: hypothetical protein VFS12_07285, partial [Terriglobia bacterium]|nr:hypothetical protein [Terriglobia bacterium]
GRLVDLHLVTSRTTHEDYYFGSTMHSNETQPAASQNMPGKYTMQWQFHHPNRRLGTAHKSSIAPAEGPSSVPLGKGTTGGVARTSGDPLLEGQI